MAEFGQRYILHEELGHGGMGVVYRATDRLTGHVVALKQLTQSPSTPDSISFDRKIALAHEFKILASLRHPNIISVLDYGFHEQFPYFTMELLPAPQRLTDATSQSTQETQIMLLIQVLQALSYLHWRGITHRDLKPANIAVVEYNDSPTIKLLDFGLSVSPDSVSNPKNIPAGTLAYMAPEILQGHLSGEASDLYSLGIIAYEVLTGLHPYSTHDISELLQDIFHKQPKMMANISENPEIEPIIQRLTHKDHTQRYDSAAQVIHDICTATGLPVPQEKPAIRESFLQSARLIGRGLELEQLNNALNNTLNGQGSAWLIGGESGVGKSRLLDEIRTHAMVQGAIVVNGHSISEGGPLFGLWRPIIRRLLLHTPVSDVEAHTLSSVVPDIYELLGRKPPQVAISATPDTDRDHLAEIVLNLLRRQHQPVVMILENLHWTLESLSMLVRVLPLVEKMPLLIIGSYCSDENAEVPAFLPNMRLITLNQLSPQEIALFTEQIFSSIRQSDQVAKLLERETKGNMFFLVEVMRALAEEAGSIDKVGEKTLPEHVFAGGIEQIVQRRLQRVPAPAQHLLKLAAIAGRNLDLPVLDHALKSRQSRRKLDELLQACADANVFEAIEANWRFTHDKLREGVLKNLSEYERPVLYRQIAESIEAVHTLPDSKSVMLAHLWSVAGDRHKQITHLIRAGNSALHNDAEAEATQFYEQAIELIEEIESDALDQSYIDALIKLASMRSSTKSLTILVARLRHAITLAEKAGDEIRVAHIRERLGRLHLISGNISESLHNFKSVMQSAHRLNNERLLILPVNILGRTSLIAGQINEARDLLGQGIQLAEQFQSFNQLARSLAYLAVIEWLTGNRDGGDHYARQSLDWGEKHGNPHQTARNCVILAGGAVVCHWYDRALTYLHRAEQASITSPDMATVYLMQIVRGCVAISSDDTNAANQYLEQSLTLASEHKFSTLVHETTAYRAILDIRNGRIQDGLKHLRSAEQRATQNGQLLNIPDIKRLTGVVLHDIGRIDEAAVVLREAITAARQMGIQPYLADSLLELARVTMSLNDSDAAKDHLDEAIGIYRTLSIPTKLKEAQAIRSKL